jgi:hypothetical protein
MTRIQHAKLETGSSTAKQKHLTRREKNGGDERRTGMQGSRIAENKDSVVAQSRTSKQKEVCSIDRMHR